jgi:hypothetical protein
MVEPFNIPLIDKFGDNDERYRYLIEVPECTEMPEEAYRFDPSCKKFLTKYFNF